MLSPVRLASSLCILALCHGVAMANDSSATLGAGGILLTKSAGIDLQREDLLISVSRISVSYRFKNVTSSDIRTRIAFPLPEWDEEIGDVDLDANSQNPMRMRVGKPTPADPPSWHEA